MTVTQTHREARRLLKVVVERLGEKVPQLIAGKSVRLCMNPGTNTSPRSKKTVRMGLATHYLVSDSEMLSTTQNLETFRFSNDGLPE